MLNYDEEQFMDEKWEECYSSRWDRLMTIKSMLQDWWPKTDAEKKCIEAIISKIDKYLDFLDEE